MGNLMLAYDPMDAVITVGPEDENLTINVAIQFKDKTGANLQCKGSVLAYLSDDQDGGSIVSAEPYSVTIGDGLLIPILINAAYNDGGLTIWNKTMFRLVSESDGAIDLNIAEEAAPEDDLTRYLILIMPGGRLVASGPITWQAGEPVPTILTLAPETAENIVNTEHELTATLLDQYDNPIEGAEITFTVSGGHTKTDTATTDEDGIATWSYSEATTGNDTIVASIGELESNEVAKTWKTGD